jgi:hypothetical protein
MNPRAVKCSSCPQMVVFLRSSKNGPFTRKMPINEETVGRDDDTFDASKGHVSHFATCPNANQHRRKR